MCITWTIHYACGCDGSGRERRSGCDGNCTGENIIYDESRDTTSPDECAEHIAARQLPTPSTSSDSSASDTSDE